MKGRSAGHKRGPLAAGRATTDPKHGDPWSAESLPTKICSLRRQAILAGVPLQNKGDGPFVLDRLRHTAAAKLLMAGVDVGTVARLLGTYLDGDDRDNLQVVYVG